MADLPPHARAAVQRILDAEARRLLADQLDRDALVAASGSDSDLVDGGADQGTASLERESIPVLGRVDRDDGTLAA